MYQVTYTITSIDELHRKLDAFGVAHPEKKDHMLIMAFTHWDDPSTLAAMVEVLKKAFPAAVIAGMTTAGGIADGNLMLQETVVSFLVFQHTDVHLLSYDLSHERSSEAGRKAFSVLSGMKHLAGVCCLSTIWTLDPSPITSALSSLPDTIPVFGGGADTCDAEKTAFIFDGDHIFEKGILLIAFCGELHIGVKSLLGWHGLGRYMTITATNGDQVISQLDGRPAVEIYEKYLKIYRNKNFGHEILSFPLLLTRHGKELARLPVGCQDDGSLVMSSDCHVGEKVRLAYGDPNEIVHTCRELSHRIWHFHPEGMLMFSCITRRTFMKENAETVLAMYKFSPSSAGGYTHGEIKRSQGVVDVLNMTQVTAALTEKPLSKPDAKVYFQPLEDNPITLSDSLSTLERLAAFVATTSEELEKAYHQIAYVADHDGLTGLLNRSAIETIMEQEITAAAANNSSLSAIMIDLDNFKSVNDTYGHEEGDHVLKTVADLMTSHIRKTDFAGRWGGDEFVILLPDTTLAMAESVANRIHHAFLESPDLTKGTVHVTASFGCTTSSPSDTQESFYKHMDSALYKAKGNGKNQVTLG